MEAEATSGAGGLRERLFSRYWRRRFRAARDMGAFLGEVRRRQAELAALASRAEARLASRPGEEDGALRPAALLRPLSPAALTCPETGAGFGPGLTLHHDAGPRSAFMVSQRKGAGPTRFALHLEAYEFDGAFVSFSLAAPPGFRRPRAEDVIRLDLDVVASRPVKGFFRLARARPGARAVSEAEGELGAGPLSIRFGAPGAATEPREDDALWVDVILDRPRMAAVAIREFSLTLLSGGGRA